MAKVYNVVNASDGYGHLGEFKTKKDAEKFIKELKRFDKEYDNPFDDEYVIEIEEE